MSVKSRMEKLRISQVDMILELRERGYEVSPPMMSSILRGTYIYFTFKIEGISRACSHQLVRHRHCSFTQRSQRYCSEENFLATIPGTFEKAPQALDVVTEFMEHTVGIYDGLIERGVPKEDARYILPNACETSLYLSCNLRELIHMSNERLCSKAQWEIRELVQQMVYCVNADLWFMLVPKCKSGRIICNSPCGGVKE